MKFVIVAFILLSGIVSCGTLQNDVDFGLIAVKAANWIVDEASCNDIGCYWNDKLIGQELEKYNRTFDLYSGVAGSVVFLMEAYLYSGNITYLDISKKGGDYIVFHLPTILSGLSTDTGLYHGGISGVGFALHHIYQFSKNEKYLDGANEIFKYIVNHQDKGELETEYKWVVRWGSAGVGFYLLDIYRSTGLKEALDLAKLCGDFLISAAHKPLFSSGQLFWYYSPKTLLLELPNYADGTAGIAYYLGALYNTSGDVKYLNAAISGASYLQSIANTANGGCIIYHHNVDKDLVYLTECNGPTGTGRLFSLLSQITGNQTWQHWSNAGTQTLLSHGGSLETGFNWYFYQSAKTAKMWMNYGQCDGHAGVLEYLMLQYEITNNSTLFQYLVDIATDIVNHRTDYNNGTYWTTEEWRTKPDESRYPQTGYMQGAAGIGSALLQLNGLMTGRDVRRLYLPDDPHLLLQQR